MGRSWKARIELRVQLQIIQPAAGPAPKGRAAAKQDSEPEDTAQSGPAMGNQAGITKDQGQVEVLKSRIVHAAPGRHQSRGTAGDKGPNGQVTAGGLSGPEGSKQTVHTEKRGPSGWRNVRPSTVYTSTNKIQNLQA